MGRLEGTERQRADHRQPRLSCSSALDQREASARRRAEGQGACFPRATGLGSRRRAQLPRGGYPGTPGCEAGVEQRLSGREASILPGLGKEPGPPQLLRSPVTHAERLLTGDRGAELGEQRRGCARWVPQDAAPKARRGGAGSRGRRPRNPTPAAAACSRGHRPQAAGPARGRKKMRRHCRVPSSAAPAIGEIKVCSMRLVCSASHIRRAASCSTSAHGTNK